MAKRIHFSSFSALFALTLALSAQASDDQVPAIYAGANLKLGEELIKTHQCTSCHQSKVGGDGSAMYKPGKRLKNAGFLRGMVEMCNTEMNMQMFPEEVTSVAAVLNRDYYHFKK